MSEPAAKQRPPIDLDEFERRLRGPAPVTPAQEDPLAELARLVGGAERFRAPAAGLPKATYQPLVGSPRDWRSEETAAPDFDPGSLRGALPETHDEYPVEPAFPHDEDDFFAQGELGGERPRRSHRAALLMGGSLALVLAGIAVTFATKGHAPAGGEAPTIKAAAGPTKVQPAAHDNVDVADRNATLLNRSDSDRVAASKIVDHQEQPVDLQSIKFQRSDASASPAGSAPTQAAKSAAPVPAAAAASHFPDPIRVHTVSVRPDGTIIADNPAPTPPARPVAAPSDPLSASHQPVGSAPANSSAGPSVVMPLAQPTTPKTTARVVTTPKTPEKSADRRADAPVVPPANIALPSKSVPTTAPIKPTRIAALEPGDIAKTAPALANPGTFAVQLAAPVSEQEAKDAMARLEKKFTAELRGRHISVIKADSNGRTVFRVRVVGLTGDDANVLCSKLKAGGGACFVAHD
jgi:hypothetical protein